MSDWISVEDRLPTEGDADCFGQVWVYEPKCNNPTYLWGWEEPENNKDAITHWMPTGFKKPEPPK